MMDLFTMLMLAGACLSALACAVVAQRRFVRKVICLEDEYANTPSNVVPWCSDTSSLCCFGNGGAHGGRIHIEISGAESSGYEAIVVTATFAENDTGWSETSIAKATAVRVEVTTQDNVNDMFKGFEVQFR